MPRLLTLAKRKSNTSSSAREFLLSGSNNTNSSISSNNLNAQNHHYNHDNSSTHNTDISITSTMSPHSRRSSVTKATHKTSKTAVTETSMTLDQSSASWMTAFDAVSSPETPTPTKLCTPSTAATTGKKHREKPSVQQLQQPYPLQRIATKKSSGGKRVRSDPETTRHSSVFTPTNNNSNTHIDEDDTSTLSTTASGNPHPVVSPESKSSQQELSFSSSEDADPHGQQQQQNHPAGIRSLVEKFNAFGEALQTTGAQDTTTPEAPGRLYWQSKLRHSQQRRIEDDSPSDFTGASTQVATNKAVDLAMERIRQIEGNTSYMEYYRDPPQPPGAHHQKVRTATMPSSARTRSIPIEAKSLLSDTSVTTTSVDEDDNSALVASPLVQQRSFIKHHDRLAKHVDQKSLEAMRQTIMPFDTCSQSISSSVGVDINGTLSEKKTGLWNNTRTQQLATVPQEEDDDEIEQVPPPNTLEFHDSAKVDVSSLHEDDLNISDIKNASGNSSSDNLFVPNLHSHKKTSPVRTYRVAQSKPRVRNTETSKGNGTMQSRETLTAVESNDSQDPIFCPYPLSPMSRPEDTESDYVSSASFALGPGSHSANSTSHVSNSPQHKRKGAQERSEETQEQPKSQIWKTPKRWPPQHGQQMSETPVEEKRPLHHGKPTTGGNRPQVKTGEVQKSESGAGSARDAFLSSLAKRESPGYRMEHSPTMQKMKGPRRKKGLDELLKRKKPQVERAEDVPLDVKSIRSAFENMQDPPGTRVDEPGDDDDSASVKSLRDRFEEVPGKEKETSISRVRLMFEKKKPPAPARFQSESSTIKEVFSKFEGHETAARKPKADKGLLRIPSEVKTVTSSVKQQHTVAPRGLRSTMYAGFGEEHEEKKTDGHDEFSSGMKMSVKLYGDRFEQKTTFTEESRGNKRHTAGKAMDFLEEEEHKHAVQGLRGRFDEPVQKAENANGVKHMKSVFEKKKPPAPKRFETSDSAIKNVFSRFEVHELEATTKPRRTKRNENSESGRTDLHSPLIKIERDCSRKGEVATHVGDQSDQKGKRDQTRTSGLNRLASGNKSDATSSRRTDEIMRSSTKKSEKALSPTKMPPTDGTSRSPLYPHDEDDVTSVRGLREKFVEPAVKHDTDNGISRARSMFEKKKPPAPKRFQSETSAVKKVFSKFEGADKAGKAVTEESTTEGAHDVEKKPLSVADRIKAFGIGPRPVSPTEITSCVSSDAIGKGTHRLPPESALEMRKETEKPAFVESVKRFSGKLEQEQKARLVKSSAFKERISMFSGQSSAVEKKMEEKKGTSNLLAPIAMEKVGTGPVEKPATKTNLVRPVALKPQVSSQFHSTVPIKPIAVKPASPQQPNSLLGISPWKQDATLPASRQWSDLAGEAEEATAEETTGENESAKNLSFQEESREISDPTGVTQENTSPSKSPKPDAPGSVWSKRKEGEAKEKGHSSDSEFSDGVTLDLSIAEVSGLTNPTAIMSRADRSVVVGNDEIIVCKKKSEKRRIQQAPAELVRTESEAKRSEASSSQPSEAAAPLIAKAMRLIPMSDDASADSFFASRASAAKRGWGKVSSKYERPSTPVAPTIAEEPLELSHESGDEVEKGTTDSGWDIEQVLSFFPKTAASVSPTFFDLGRDWESFRSFVDIFPEKTNRKATSETPARKDTGGESATAPKDDTGSPIQKTEARIIASSSVPVSPPEMKRAVDLLAGPGEDFRPWQGRPGMTVQNAIRLESAVPMTRTVSVASEDCVSIRLPAGASRSQQSPQSNGGPWKRNGPRHLALLSRLRNLKEARLRRAVHGEERTTSIFSPSDIEGPIAYSGSGLLAHTDDYSSSTMSTRSSTRFGGSVFMAALEVD